MMYVMGKVRMIFLSGVLVIFAAAAAGSLETAYPLPERVRLESGETPDEAWLLRFREELAARLQAGRISEAAVMLVAESVPAWNGLPDDPSAAAERIYEHTRTADRGLKTGEDPIRIRLRVRQQAELRVRIGLEQKDSGREHAEEIRRRIVNSVPPARENQFIHRRDDHPQPPGNQNYSGGGR